MSRDLTPRELYAFEQQNIKIHSYSLWDYMRNTVMHINGETFPMYSEEDISNREQYPSLGRLYNDFDNLYAFLSNIEGGLDLLQDYDNSLKKYIETGIGDKESALIKWFEGTLDKNFYYSTHNDNLFLASVKEDIFKIYRSDPTKEKCFWFPLTDDKCISVWYAPDKYDGDQLQMKLELRGEDGSMGSHCEILIDESYATADLSYDAIFTTVKEIYADVDLVDIPNHVCHKLTDNVMSVFELKKHSLDNQIKSAASAAINTNVPTDHLSKNEKAER